MGNRVPVLAAAGAILLLAAWWLSSEAGPHQAPAVPAAVEIQASRFGVGTWARYSVTVKNAGDMPFAGAVTLLTSQGATTRGGLNGIPERVPTAVPQVPAAAPAAGYRVAVRLAPHQFRTFALAAPDGYGLAAVIADADGSLVASTPVELSPSAAIAVLSRNQAPADQLSTIHFDDVALHVTRFSDARGFPVTLLGLAGFVAVVIDQFDAGSLAAAQREALADFVAQGGSLVVAGGRDWKETLGSLPPELEGLKPLGSGTASLGPVLSLTGRAGSPVVEVAVAEAARGRTVIASPERLPLIAASERGAGLVVDLAFDPAALPEDAAAAAWGVALAPALSNGPLSAITARTVPPVDAVTAQAVAPPPGASLPSPWLVGSLLVLYVVAVAPLNYLLMRRRGRPDRLWMSTPLIAGSFTAALYGLGALLLGDVDDSSLQVLKVGPGSIVGVEYHRVLFTNRGDHAVAWTAPALAAPLTGQLTLLGCGDRCGLDLGGLRSGQETVFPAQRPTLSERGVVYGGERVFGASFVSHASAGVDARLELNQGRLTGEIKNSGRVAVQDLAVYLPVDGQVAVLEMGGFLEPGRLISVDGQLRPVGVREPAGEARRLARQAALESARAGGAWLAGTTRPLPSAVRVDGKVPPTRGVAVFEQPVALAVKAGSMADLAPVRLVASAGERSRGGFTDVYDLELPPGTPGSVGVTFQKSLYAAGVEVFDWSAGTWRATGFTSDVANPGSLRSLLTPSEIAHSGGGPAAVRVRVAEPRIEWGRGVWLFAEPVAA